MAWPPCGARRGNITGQELVHRFWQGFIGGGYVGHAETFRKPDDVLWWAKGGTLRGESPARIRFLRALVEKGGRMVPVDVQHFAYPVARQQGEYLVYLGRSAPRYLESAFLAQLEKSDPGLKNTRWRFEVIDPWAMTTTPIAGEHKGTFEIPLPARPYLALRIVPTTDFRGPYGVP
jgi:hypothetical protein